uniref:Uncharacterized protein n=1 Tax=Oryza glumipatula TaxID=40148 RepID=A0A0E0A8W3_9ORYZ
MAAAAAAEQSAEQFRGQAKLLFLPIGDTDAPHADRAAAPPDRRCRRPSHAPPGYVFIKENKGKLEIRNGTVPISSRLYFECQQTYSCIMADITNKLLLPNYRRTIDDKLFQRKVPGGIMRGFFLMVLSSRRHFSYAGFEQQPKKFVSPKIRLLNIEQELKYEKENAEIRL